MDSYLLGKRNNDWHPGEATQITFVVTKNCNLRCKYCYMTGKNDNERMSFKVAKDAIDYFFTHKKELFKKKYVILDFIGGEPLLEIDLIDDIVDYFKYLTFKNDDSWFGRYRINISTNGILYSSKKVQKFILKNKNNLSIGISIDGTKEKHDLQRVYPDGSGSYDDVINNVKLWIEQYPNASTKVTIGHDDLPYVKESIIHLWNLGIKNVPANVIFEDVWEDGDSEIFEEQLRKLADYIIENELWHEFNTTLFSEHLGFKQVEDELNKNFCGTGKAYAVDAKGNIYPCVRYMEYSLNNKKEVCLGNIYDGVDFDKVRPFMTLTVKTQSPQQCLDCSVSTGCAYCQAENYDSSSMNTNYERSLASCEMHKARVRANNYYWARLYNLYNIDRLESGKYKKSFDKLLYIMMASDCAQICVNYTKQEETPICINSHNLQAAFAYAQKNFCQPYIIHKNKVKEEENILFDKKIQNIMEGFIIKHIVPYSSENLNILLKRYQKQDIYPVFDMDTIENVSDDGLHNCILLVRKNEILHIYEWVKLLSVFYKRINLKCEIQKKEDLQEYELQLEKISDLIVESFEKGRNLEVSVVSDKLFIDNMADNCNSGEKHFTFGPDGKLYLCPALYYDNLLNEEIQENELKMTYLNRAPICLACDAYQCERCVYLNKKRTLEFNIPSSLQCIKSHVERKITLRLKKQLEEKFGVLRFRLIEEVSYEEPYMHVLEEWRLTE